MTITEQPRTTDVKGLEARELLGLAVWETFERGTHMFVTSTDYLSLSQCKPTDVLTKFDIGRIAVHFLAVSTEAKRLPDNKGEVQVSFVQYVRGKKPRSCVLGAVVILGREGFVYKMKQLQLIKNTGKQDKYLLVKYVKRDGEIVVIEQLIPKDLPMSPNGNGNGHIQ